MEEKLSKIRDFADRAHGEQKRKYTGERYIVHPIRVMELTREYTQELPALAAALLHDVLEDTPVTEAEIRDFLSNFLTKDEVEQTIRLVVDLTDIFITEDYPKLNRHKRKTKEADRLSRIDPLAQTVKYADAIDNAVDIAKNDLEFAKLFLLETANLLKKMDKGDPKLYKRAVETVDRCIKDISSEQ
jgi:guanosine-3',5'-bis(diphosphate) 3'-pyrophosphohydrolase